MPWLISVRPQDHGLTRFQPAWTHDSGFRPPHQGIAGYRREVGDVWEYYLTPSTLRMVLEGLNSNAVADALIARRLLLAPGKGPHKSQSIRIPGAGRQRLYHLAAEIVQGDPE